MLTRHLTALTLTALAILGPVANADAPAIPSTDSAINHALNRLTFGPRPGDEARVKREGLQAWIERQLDPSRIDDRETNDRLARLSTLSLDSATLAREVHQPARRERQRLLREKTAAPVTGNPDQPPLKLRRSAEALRAKAEGSPPQAPGSGSGNPEGLPPQGSSGGDPLGSPRSTRPGRGSPDALRRPTNDIVRRDQQIITDLSEAKVLRAIYSDRQLEEVLVDFWFNHFNVFAGKGPTRVWLGEFEREAIRPNVLGNFRTLVGSVAKSPAMLFYLDNWMNVDPDSGNQQPATGGKAQGKKAEGRRHKAEGVPPPRRANGLNENYARELMELHTLGVDGGYTQQDVVNVARAFTGWTLTAPNGRPFDSALTGRAPRSGQAARVLSGFRFDPRLHDAAEKTVLGHTIKAGGGIDDGERVLDILVAHPSTAHFIAEKLARRFVSDTPPEALVKRAAATFSSTHGDLRQTVRAIITSPEFFAAESYHAKVKTPFEFVVSAFRATQADLQVALPVVRELRELGMPLYLCQPPTGYDDTASTWVSSGALVSRMNFALAVGGGRVRGVTLPFTPSSPIESVRATLLSNALAGSASAGTIATIEKAATVEQTIALALGSPEFQRR